MRVLPVPAAALMTCPLVVGYTCVAAIAARGLEKAQAISPSDKLATCWAALKVD